MAAGQRPVKTRSLTDRAFGFRLYTGRIRGPVRPVFPVEPLKSTASGHCGFIRGSWMRWVAAGGSQGANCRDGQFRARPT